MKQKRFKEAEEQYCKALEVARVLGNVFMIGIELIGVTMSVSGQHRYSKAIKVSTAASGLSMKLGIVDPAGLQLTFWQELVEKHLHSITSKIGEDQIKKYQDAGRNFDLDTLIDYALKRNID